MKNKELLQALEQIGQGYRVERHVIIEALGAAMSSASKKVSGHQQQIRVEVDEVGGELKLYAQRTVVEKVVEPGMEMTIEQARVKNKAAQIGDVIEEEVDFEGYGRIAAQTARQVVLQRMREVERDQTYEQFKAKSGEVVAARVLRLEGDDIIAEVGDVEALLPRREQMFKENLRRSDLVKVFILEVRRGGRGPQLVVSRTHPHLLKRLMEMEVPEIADGTIEVKAVAREPGYRAKVAVASKNANVDAVGTCLGARSTRLQPIVRELQGEKIDVIEWSDDIKKFLAHTLSPAPVLRVDVDEAQKRVSVLVADDQLSLAIGKKGQNVRLVSKLTGWKVDVKSEARKAEEHQEAMERLTAVEGISDAIAEKLIVAGFTTPGMVAEGQPEALAKIEGVGTKGADRLIEVAKAFLAQRQDASAPATSGGTPESAPTQPSGEGAV